MGNLRELYHPNGDIEKAIEKLKTHLEEQKKLIKNHFLIDKENKELLNIYVQLRIPGNAGKEESLFKAVEQLIQKLSKFHLSDWGLALIRHFQLMDEAFLFHESSEAGELILKPIENLFETIIFNAMRRHVFGISEGSPGGCEECKKKLEEFDGLSF